MWGPHVLFWEDFYLKLAQNNTYRAHVWTIWVCLRQYVFGSTIWVPSGIYVGHMGPSQPRQNPYGPQMLCYLGIESAIKAGIKVRWFSIS